MKILKHKFLALVLLFIFALLCIEFKNQSMQAPEVSLVEDSSWTLGSNQKKEFESLAKNLSSKASFLGFVSGYRQQIQHILSLPFIESAKVHWSFRKPIKIKAHTSRVRAMMFKQGEWFLLNTSGEVLKEVAQNQTLDVPIISSEKVLKTSDLRNKTLNLFKKLENFDAGLSLKQVSEVSFDQRGLFFIFSPGYKVYLSEKNFAKQSQRLKEVFKYLELKNINVEFVDAQFANKILVRPKDQRSHAL